ASCRCRSHLLLSHSSLVLCPPMSTLFPYTTLFRSVDADPVGQAEHPAGSVGLHAEQAAAKLQAWVRGEPDSEGPVGGKIPAPGEDRKSTRLNSSHVKISYAVFCLKKKR